MRPREHVESEGPRNDLHTIASLAPYLWPKGRGDLRIRVVISMVFLVLAKVATVYIPLFYRDAVDVLTPTDPTAVIVALPIALLVGYGLVRIASQTFGELRDAVFAKVAQSAIRRVGLETFRHLHALSLRFHLDRKTGGVARAVERGTKGVEFLLTFMLFNILPTLLEILMVCGILWVLFDIWFALVTFVTIVSYIAWTLLVTEWRIQFRRQMNDTDSEAHTKAIDSLLNYETVKYFGNEDHEGSRFDSALARYETAAVKSKTTLSYLNIGQGAIISVGLTIIMLMAGNGVVAGDLTLGDFVLVNAYLIQLYMPLNFLGFVYREIKHSLTDMEQMFSLLRVNAEIADKPGAPPLKSDGGAIRFDDVTFAYDPRRPVLKNVSFEVPAGKSLAIVGPSGSGKSTISRILFRFYDVGDGSVTIDGQDIRDVTQASVRAAIGMVPQDTVLFNDTVHYNIAYGRPGASEDEIIEAARLARIDTLIARLPDGYKTSVGERGLKLSGGEKQRVAIARSILKRPAIMLFDEATSALDTQTEQEIQQSLREVSEGRTTLVIAHRLSTVVDADEIIVLKEGEIQERGTHTDLLAADGMYAQMWQRQQEAREAEEKLAETRDALVPDPLRKKEEAAE